MGNVLTLKTKWQDCDDKKLAALKKHLDAILVPYPPSDTFKQLMDYVSQAWVMDVIVERWKFGVIASLMEYEYETVH